MNITLNLRPPELTPTEPLLVPDPVDGQGKVRLGANDTGSAPSPFSDIRQQHLPVITPSSQVPGDSS